MTYTLCMFMCVACKAVPLCHLIILTNVLFNEMICFDFGRKTLKMTCQMKVMMTMLGLSLLLDVLISQVKHCAAKVSHKKL